METSLNIPASRLAQFQQLVKQHDLRFVGNPVILRETVSVIINGDHLPPGGCNQFFSDWDRLTTPIREVCAPRWKRILRRFGFNM